MLSKLLLLAIAIVFVIHCLSLDFTQDDAYISYRYAENLIQGNGLVFNSGERVEGYTNFLWTILLSLFAKLGLDMITVSKILGIASGCVTLLLLHQISRLFFPKRDWLLALFPPFLLTASSAFAYWSISGLETSFFVMMVLLSVYLYLTRPRLSVLSCSLSALVRPEGVLIFAILLLHKLLFRKDRFDEFLLYVGGFGALLLPFAVFKLLYYGNVLPNSFYAKTGLSFEYVRSGLEYFWQFVEHYGLWGVLYLLPIVLYRRLDSPVRLLALLVYIFTLCVILIGGDVLKAHRFFLPILPIFYLLFVVCLQKLIVWIRSSIVQRAVVTAVLLLASSAFFLIPHGWIREVRAAEEGLVEKMRFVAEYFNEHYRGSFTIALPTIGAASYYLGTEVRVIDMLGLTDRYISRHPEKIEGIAATWKERKYNSRYVLSRDPDFILFSTGHKPSAPAERALLLNSKFRQNYFVIPILEDEMRFVPVFKMKGVYSGENEIFEDTRFVDLFYDGVSLAMRGRHRQAIDRLNEVVLIAPKDFALPYELMGQYSIELIEYLAAEGYFKKAIEIDDHTVLSHVFLASIHQANGRDEEAEKERRKVYLYDPNFPW